MIALDTNVLARYLLRDDPRQFALASGLIDAARERDESVFIPTIVLAEVMWVMTSVYDLRKPDLLPALERILAASEPRAGDLAEPMFTLENAAAVRAAVEDYAAGPADFADYLIGRIAHAAGATTTYTFDRRAAAAPTFKQLRG